MHGMDTLLLHRDDDIVVVNKPAGVVTHRQRPGDGEDARELAERAAGLPPGSLRAVHRLDSGTSGVLLFARHKRSARHYCALFAGRKVAKVYVALVEGALASNELTCDGPIRATARRCFVAPTGKSARTDVTVTERFDTHTLCRVTPATGRKHQIRTHLAHAGHPVAGDVVYGAAGFVTDVDGAQLTLPTPLLHAATLTLPRRGAPALVVSAPLPPYFLAVLTALRRAV